MNKTMDEAYDLIENIALNHYQWFNEREKPQEIPGNYNVDVINILSSKVDMLFKKFENFNVNPVANFNVVCELCGSNSHSTECCELLDTTSSDQVNFVNSYGENVGMYSNTYNPE